MATFRPEFGHIQAMFGHIQAMIKGCLTGPEDLDTCGLRKLERKRLARFLNGYVQSRPRLVEAGRTVPEALSR